MKKILLSISTVLLLFVGNSCEDFLKEEPTTELSKEAVYSTEENALSELNGCYSSLASYDAYGYRYYHLLTTTSGMGVSTKANEIAMTSLQIESNDNNVESVYRAQYRTIGIANDILANVPNSSLKDVVKKKMIGEASFIRAMSYFNLVRLFGPVSLITKPVENFNDAHFQRAAVADVYALIIADLEAAAANLVEPDQQAVGRPHKFAAEALLAKVYLTMAGNTEGSEYWEKAYAAAKEVYDAKCYSLIPSFTSVFDVKNKNNKEIIFSIQFHTNQGGCSLTEMTLPSRNFLTPSATASNVWGKTRPCKDAFDLFVNTYPNDPRIDGTFLHTKYYKLDVKKDINIYPSKTKTGAGQNADDFEYPFIKKYVDPSYVTSSSCNFIYYRYADLLLVLAEAANETGRTAESIGYVNEVLKRARDKDGNGAIEVTEISPIAWDLALGKEQVRAKIMVERQIELFGEADEWYTVRRRGFDFFKTIVDRHNAHAALNVAALPKFVYRYPATDNDIKRNLLLPFPANEIARNESISQDEQNFGY